MSIFASGGSPLSLLLHLCSVGNEQLMLTKEPVSSSTQFQQRPWDSWGEIKQSTLLVFKANILLSVKLVNLCPTIQHLGSKNKDLNNLAKYPLASSIQILISKIKSVWKHRSDSQNSYSLWKSVTQRSNLPNPRAFVLQLAQ